MYVHIYIYICKYIISDFRWASATCQEFLCCRCCRPLIGHSQVAKKSTKSYFRSRSMVEKWTGHYYIACIAAVSWLLLLINDEWNVCWVCELCDFHHYLKKYLNLRNTICVYCTFHFSTKERERGWIGCFGYYRTFYLIWNYINRKKIKDCVIQNSKRHWIPYLVEFEGDSSLSLNGTIKLTLASISRRLPHSATLKNQLIWNHHDMLLVPLHCLRYLVSLTIWSYELL